MTQTNQDGNKEQGSVKTFSQELIAGAIEMGQRLAHDVKTADQIHALYKELPDCPLKNHLAQWFESTPPSSKGEAATEDLNEAAIKYWEKHPHRDMDECCDSFIAGAHYLKQPSGEVTVDALGEWQLCPKCGGEGTIDLRYNPQSTTVTNLCDVCNGAKILARPQHNNQGVTESK